MLFKLKFNVFFIAASVWITTVLADSIKDSMYEDIEGNAACFRKLNATHQIGCTSHRTGSTGVIHVINDKSDIDWMLENGTAAPYIPVISPELFTRDILLEIKAHYPNQVSGVIVRNDTKIPKSFSHEKHCPNDVFSLNGTCDATVGGWNPIGTGLLYEDFPFPIFIVTNVTEIEKIVNCSEKFNNFDLHNQPFRSLCSLELKSFMFATTDTETCIRRSNIFNNLKPVKFCDPLGDRSVWGTLFPRGNYTDNTTEVIDVKSSKVIVLAARLDGTSMFDGVTPGASSPVSGLVTLLSTAYVLKKMVNSTTATSDKNILFIIFNGESYEYIGSQRILYEMEKNSFPMMFDHEIKYNVPNIKIDDIELFVEISQLGNLENLKIFHTDYADANAKEKVNEFLAAMKRNAPFKEEIGLLPPSSLQTFLKEHANIPGIVLADHERTFQNQYYHSIYDSTSNIKYQYYNASSLDQSLPNDTIQYKLASVSEALAKTLYRLLYENSILSDNITTPSVLVDELLYCYLVSSKCKVFKAATFEEVLLDTPLNLYVGVSDWLNPVTTVTGFTLAMFIGDVVQNTTQCKRDPQLPVFRYGWIHGEWNATSTAKGVCLRSTVNFTIAKSPAFDIDDYNWKSGKYSTWSESTWHDFSVRIFLKPSSQHENITITIGSTVIVLSFLIVYFANKKADILFNIKPTMVGTSC